MVASTASPIAAGSPSFDRSITVASMEFRMPPFTGSSTRWPPPTAAAMISHNTAMPEPLCRPKVTRAPVLSRMKPVGSVVGWPSGSISVPSGTGTPLL